jgi:hypothetical protein
MVGESGDLHAMHSIMLLARGMAQSLDVRRRALLDELSVQAS